MPMIQLLLAKAADVCYDGDGGVCMMKRLLLLFLCLILVLPAGLSAAEMSAQAKPIYPYKWKGNRLVRSYQT